MAIRGRAESPCGPGNGKRRFVRMERDVPWGHSPWIAGLMVKSTVVVSGTVRNYDFQRPSAGGFRDIGLP